MYYLKSHFFLWHSSASTTCKRPLRGTERHLPNHPSSSPAGASPPTNHNINAIVFTCFKSIVTIAAIISVIIISKQFGEDGQLLPFIAICQQLKWQRWTGRLGRETTKRRFCKEELGEGSLNKYDWERNLTTKKQKTKTKTKKI